MKSETIAATGLVDYLGSQACSLLLNESVCSATTLNNLNEHRFVWKDVVHCRALPMIHSILGLIMHAEQEGAVNAEISERLHKASFVLLNGDGTPLAGLYG